jgi:hypothetical protein
MCLGNWHTIRVGRSVSMLSDELMPVAKRRTDQSYSIIPISDNGGSSSELIRVFGGPGIGDVRSM